VGAAILHAIETHKHDTNSVLFLTDLEALHPFLRIGGGGTTTFVGRFSIPTRCPVSGHGGRSLQPALFSGVHKGGWFFLK